MVAYLAGRRVLQMPAERYCEIELGESSDEINGMYVVR